MYNIDLHNYIGNFIFFKFSRKFLINHVFVCFEQQYLLVKVDWVLYFFDINVPYSKAYNVVRASTKN